MPGKKNRSEDDISPEDSEKTKKQWRLNALILAGVFLLSALLPPRYRAFAPLLFVIPFVVSVVNKIRQVREKFGSPPQGQIDSPPISGRIPSQEPYTYKPKDPKDLRRYKPIG